MARAVEEITHHGQSYLGPLNVGVTPVAAANLVPRALARLKQQMPSLVVRVYETVFHDGTEGLLKGRLDLMVGPIGVYAPVDGIEEKSLTLDPFRIVVRSGHPLTRRKSVSLKQARNEEWVLPSDQSAFHRQLEALFIVAGTGWPDHAILTNSVIAMKAIVMHSECLAIMPKQLVEIEQKVGLLQAIRLAEAGEARALGISWVRNRKRSNSAEAMINTLVECSRRPR